MLILLGCFVFVPASELSGTTQTLRSVPECVCVYESVFIRRMLQSVVLGLRGVSKPGRAGSLFSECVRVCN